MPDTLIIEHPEDPTKNVNLVVSAPTGRKQHVKQWRASTAADPRIQRTARYKIGGTPAGASREGADGFLGIDYASLDHGYPELLLPPAARNTVALTNPSALIQYEVPDADVTTTNWSEGAGDGDASAFDELDNGIDGGTPDDTAYWTTTTEDAWLILELTNATDPIIHTGHVINARMRFRNGTGSPTARLRLYQGATVVWESDDQTLTSGFTKFAVTVAEASAANITDYTALRVAVAATELASGQNLDVSELEVEFPDTETGGNVLAIEEDRGQLFVHRGRTTTQVNPATMTEVASTDHTNVIVAVTQQSGEGMVSFGAAADVKRRTAVNATGATYAAVSSKKAGAMRFIHDRVWFEDVSGGGDDGEVRYTFDRFTTLGNPFPVGDSGIPITSFAPMGPVALVCREDGVHGFTSGGQTFTISTELHEFRSSFNGLASAYAFGWTYVGTLLGLRAYLAGAGAVENAVGLEAVDGFEGGIDGICVALRLYKGRLWAAYLSDITDPASGTLTILYGEFNPNVTPATGQLDWYFWDQQSGVDCRAFGVTAGRTNPTLIRASDDDIAYYTLGRRKRDIADANYRWQTNDSSPVGYAYLTTLQREPNLVKNIRRARVVGEDLSADNRYALQVAFDEGIDEGTYLDLGDPVTGDGYQVIEAARGGEPQENVNGVAFKPRLACYNTSATNPPKLRGFLDIEYDARPDRVLEAVYPVQLTATDLARLERYLDPRSTEGRAPVGVRFPDGERGFGLVAGLTDVVDQGGGSLAGVLTLSIWSVTEERR